jgi:hypothetical protein
VKGTPSITHKPLGERPSDHFTSILQPWLNR